jgi:hypothetical protein
MAPERPGSGEPTTAGALALWQAPARSWLERLGLRPAARTVPARGFWTGRSGRRYLHIACPIGSVPDVGPATYLICEHLESGRVRVHFAGYARDLRRQLLAEPHEARDEAVRRGARHVHFCLAAVAEAEQRAVTADLIVRLRPALNPAPSEDSRPSILAAAVRGRPAHP